MLEKNVNELVSGLFMSLMAEPFPYHNLDHTKRVVEQAINISGFYKTSEENSSALRVAAWFHDVGHLYGDMEGHEERSIRIMNNYLGSMEVTAGFIQKVADCIMATKKEAVPLTMEEKIICDADTWHFGTTYFRKTEFLVMEELEIRTGKRFPDFHTGSLVFLEKHRFYTDYCRQLLDAGKKENIKWLQALISDK